MIRAEAPSIYCGVAYRHKWDNDVQKEAVARGLGFKFHRVYEATMHLVMDVIAADIQNLNPQIEH